MNQVQNYWLQIATLGPVGYLPAGGTWASLITAIFVYMLWQLDISRDWYAGLFFVMLLAGIIIIRNALRALDRQDDPREIVFDEVLGCMLTYLWVTRSLESLILGFVLFRFFDITKILGIASCELLFGVWGVILDDLMAGILSALILQIVFVWL